MLYINIMHLLLDVYNIYLMKAKRFVYLKSLSDIDMICGPSFAQFVIIA